MFQAVRKTRAGIVGIERSMKEKHRATDKNISVAFEDLSKLMEKVGTFLFLRYIRFFVSCLFSFPLQNIFMRQDLCVIVGGRKKFNRISKDFFH